MAKEPRRNLEWALERLRREDRLRRSWEGSPLYNIAQTLIESALVGHIIEELNLEKFDITEEKVRLQNHLTYFNEIMDNDSPNGKKLGFIAQEMGREINTIGSKANHADLQKVVVQMKDELEKIKEQLLNVLWNEKR